MDTTPKQPPSLFHFLQISNFEKSVKKAISVHWPKRKRSLCGIIFVIWKFHFFCELDSKMKEGSDNFLIATNGSLSVVENKIGPKIVG
jgi:hypothetical protein